MERKRARKRERCIDEERERTKRETGMERQKKRERG